jgi:hypothetical protein
MTILKKSLILTKNDQLAFNYMIIRKQASGYLKKYFSR